jgi:leucyl aminopeptidase
MMKVSLVQTVSKTDGIILAGFEDTTLTNPIHGIDNKTLKALNELVASQEWKWEAGKTKAFYLGSAHIILTGLGKREKLQTSSYLKTFGKAIAHFLSLKVKKVAMPLDTLSPLNADMLRLLTEALLNGTYTFDKYKSDRKPIVLEEINLIASTVTNTLQAAVVAGSLTAEGMAVTRTLTNEPSNYMTPSQLAREVTGLGEKYGFAVSISDEKQIQKMKMEAFWSVAKGSAEPPRLIVMRYTGNPKKPKEIVGLVGKGLTYDSGGYALKPAEGMASMKNDMGGGAAVIGAMCVIASRKLKVNVTAVVAACENMIGDHSYRNGDVIGSMAGKTIEVTNTDAEGRLTLADAVYYAVTKENVTKLADIATLTGAAVVALGQVRIGIVDNNDNLYNALEKAADASGERIWRLPHDDEYREFLRSDIADIKNSGVRQAGTVQGGLFVRDFINDTPWVHLDIASTAFNDKEGATGSGVRILTAFCEQLAK